MVFGGCFFFFEGCFFNVLWLVFMCFFFLGGFLGVS